MYLGFETDTGNVYVGNNAPQFAVWPAPLICQVKLVESFQDWSQLPKGITSDPLQWIFREDTFDSVTRVRRGRLYEAIPGTAYPSSYPVSAQHFDHDDIRRLAAGRALIKSLHTYWPCQTFLNRNDRGLGTTLALGQGHSASGWRVIQVEQVLGNDVLVTLKALSAYGILPELDVLKVGESSSRDVQTALERVLNSAFRETAISVIDHGRNAMQVVIAHWMLQQGSAPSILEMDLDQLLQSLQKDFSSKRVARNAAEIVRLLHPRGKENAHHKMQLRRPVEEDAETAVHLLGLVLRELGWAK